MTRFLRWLFALLVALDLGAGVWLLLAHAPARSWPPVTDPGVPELKLWSGAPSAGTAPATPTTVASAAADAPSAPQPAAESCFTLGAFPTAAAMHAALQGLSPHVVRIRFRQKDATRPRGFWVILPAVDRDAVQDATHRLTAKGVTDYYVVSGGDLPNTISLGVYHDQANAQNRVAELQKLGFTAQVRQRVGTESAYWIDYAVPAGAAFDWKAWVPNRGGLASQPAACF